MASKTLICDGNAYVFKKDDNSNKTVIVSAHGAWPPSTHDTVATPAGTWHTSSFGKSTTTQVADIVNFKNHKGPKGGNPKKGNKNIWSQKPFPGQESNYVMARYADNNMFVKKTISGKETFKYYLWVAENEEIDIISPKDKQNRGIIKLSDIMDYINGANYNEVWFNFCLSKLN